MLQSRNQEMEQHATTNLRQIIGRSLTVRRRPNRTTGLSRIMRSRTGPNRIVHPRQILIFARSPIARRQYKRTIGLSRIGMILSGRKMLRRMSVLSPNTLLLPRKRGLRRNDSHSLLQ
jgi:hypothetical protein